MMLAVSATVLPGTTATVLSARSTRNVRSTAKFPKLFTVIVMYLHENSSEMLAIATGHRDNRRNELSYVMARNYLL